MAKRPSWREKVGAVFFLCTAPAIAQRFTTLVNFNGANGASPYYGSLVQSLDGDFYGTTYSGGGNDAGTIFRATRASTLTTLYIFCAQGSCLDGSGPYGGLVQTVDGNFYGTTTGGGANGFGTIFKVTRGGALKTLHSFASTDGATSAGRLVQATR